MRAETEPPQSLPLPPQSSISRADSMRRTAVSAAVAKFNKGKSLITRTSSSNVLDQSTSLPQAPVQEQYIPITLQPKSSTSSSQTFGEMNRERNRSRTVSAAISTLDIRKSEEQQQSKRSTASTVNSVATLQPQRKLSAKPPAPADPEESTKRPTTQELLVSLTMEG